jgi:thiamine-phosphate pyrophosphorylase
MPPSQPTGGAPVTSSMVPLVDIDSMIPERRLQRLASARLYFVCDARPRGDDPRATLEAALRGGADLVQMREKGTIRDEALLDAARPYREAAADHGALFIINDRPDLVERAGADGVHVGQDDLPVEVARGIAGAGTLVGLSTHSEDELDAACAAEGAARPDQISVGPVWETPTKEGRPSTGLGLIRYAARNASVPWFAIGGIDRSNIAEVAAAGAERAVVVRAIRDAEDPEAAARALRDALAAAART